MKFIKKTILGENKMKLATTSRCFFPVTVLVVVVLLIDTCQGHVGLTFPPARKYDLDFLDNVRTKPPCGMPKGKTFDFLLSNTLHISL